MQSPFHLTKGVVRVGVYIVPVHSSSCTLLGAHSGQVHVFLDPWTSSRHTYYPKHIHTCSFGRHIYIYQFNPFMAVICVLSTPDVHHFTTRTDHQVSVYIVSEE